MENLTLIAFEPSRLECCEGATLEVACTLLLPPEHTQCVDCVEDDRHCADGEAEGSRSQVLDMDDVMLLSCGGLAKLQLNEREPVFKQVQHHKRSKRSPTSKAALRATVEQGFDSYSRKLHPKGDKQLRPAASRRRAVRLRDGTIDREF